MVIRPDIDGLRAISVVSVLLYHAELGCPVGYVGVDVFFVISGYLITGLIVNDLEHGRFSLTEFWERRIRRIVPALAVTLAAVLIVGYFILLPDDLRELGASAIAQLGLVANVFVYRDTGYFTGAAEFKPLLHTWSLAVEEQFYLGYPLLLVVLFRLGRKRMVWILAAMAIGSFVLSAYGVYWKPWATFYLLPTQAWELLIGCLAALLPGWPVRRARTAELLGWLGLGMILVAVCIYDDDTPFPGTAALLPCLGAVAVIQANATQHTKIGALLARKPVVFVGLISYSLYLWHWPILAYLRYLLGTNYDLVVRLAALAASLWLAVLSRRFVEMPFRVRRIGFGRRRVFAAAAVSWNLRRIC